MIKYGIKLWSINHALFPEAVAAVKNGQADFVEVYLVPAKVDFKALEVLKEVEVTIHAPYFEHGFNIHQLNNEMISLFKSEVIPAADLLSSHQIVVHAGVGSENQIFAENVKKIHDNRIIIENKPKIGMHEVLCYGYSLEQLRFIHAECGYQICFDFSHAIISAVQQGVAYKEFIRDAVSILKPSYFHISDAHQKSGDDEHLSLGDGDYDFGYIKKLIESAAVEQEVRVVFETPKEGAGLENDLKNIQYFKNL